MLLSATNNTVQNQSAVQGEKTSDKGIADATARVRESLSEKGKAFLDEATIKEITKKHSKLALAIRNILAKLKQMFGGKISELDTAIRLWNNAYNASIRSAKSDIKVNAAAQTKNTADSGVKLSRGEQYENEITVEDLETLNGIPRKSINKFNSVEVEKTEKWARRFYKELGVKSPFFRAWFGDWRQYDDVKKLELLSLKG